MFKLFAMVIIISDSGAVTSSQIATDFATLQACQAAAAQLFAPTADLTVGGQHLTVRARTDCRSDGSGPPPPPQYVPMTPWGR